MYITRTSIVVAGIACATFFNFTSVQAATYYVDQSAGSDSNTGASPSTAWKNAPGMAAYAGSGTLRPGDTVYFDSADTWLLTGGQGLYLIGGVAYLGDSWGTGSRATLRANANLDAGVVRFRDDPTHPTILKGFDVDANHTVSTGIDLGHRYPALMKGAVKRVDNVVVRNVWSQSASNQYKYGIIISNFGGTSGYVENVEILNSVVHDISRTGIAMYPGNTDANDRIKNITVRGNEVYNTGQDGGTTGPGIMVKGYVQDAYVEYNYVHDTGIAGLYVNSNETTHYGFGPTNIHLRFNIVSAENIYGGIRIADSSSGSGSDPKDIKIYGNIVYSTTGKSGFLIDTDFRNNNRILLYNNTFYGARIYVNNTAATFSTFEVKNNIVYYPAGTPITGSSRFTAASNNLTTNPSFKDASKLPTGFAGTFGVDLVPNTDGLTLLGGSPALEKGMALGSAYSQGINTVARPQGGGWDIGAYEFKVAGEDEFAGWLVQHHLPTDGSADFADPDGDGLNNWQEWRADTNPTNSLSVLKVMSVTNNSPGLRVTWQSVTNRTYCLERATGLVSPASFSGVASNIVGHTGTTSYTDTTVLGGGPFFYRVGVQP